MHQAIKLLYSIKDEVNKTITKLQAECPHSDETLLKKYEADTGNYDPSDDRYWANLWCQICGARWTVDSSKDSEAYRFRGTEVEDWPE